MADEQDRAENLDGDTLGEQPLDDQLPGVDLSADRGPMHAEDPSLLLGGSDTRDESHTREWREQPDHDAALAPDGSTVVEQHTLDEVLVDDDPGANALTTETAGIEHDQMAPSAEEAAVNLDTENIR